MNKLFAAFFLFSILSFQAHAQYFYKDIVSNKQLSAEMAAYKEKKIHNIKLKSYEEDDKPSKGFFCEKKISKDFKKSELFTKSELSATSLFTSVFNEQGDLLASTDSSEISLTHNDYSYDRSGRVIKIFSSIKSNDDDFTSEITEEHIYQYNEKNLPVSMILVKNRRDSTKILFAPDENSNVGLEKNTKDGSKYYYYYDDKKQLTDVVHANEYRKNLVADYVFEYDEAGMLVQMTTTEEGRGKEKEDSQPNFFIWRYVNENGLRMKEGLFSKDGNLVGSVEYEYN